MGSLDVKFLKTIKLCYVMLWGLQKDIPMLYKCRQIVLDFD